MSWFEEVTGRTEYERQSWRDSYNEGRAAGDITGNVNARLDAERAANRGATVSGSSSQYSAAEMMGSGEAMSPREVAQVRGAAPAAPRALLVGVASGVPQTGTGAAVRAAASGGVVTGMMTGAFGATQAYKPMDLAIGGGDFRANPVYSNAEDVETRWSDLGSAIYTPFVMGADIGHNAARMYFGENYDRLGPRERLGILGVDAQSAVKAGAEGLLNGALSSALSGMQAVEAWGAENKRREEAAEAARRAVDDAWELREQLQAEEARKADMPRWSGNVVTAPVHW